MLPEELNKAKKELPLIFLPVGPLEWHGLHLPPGTDPLIAEKTALAVAEKVGGVVLPTLFAGTERERPPEMLKSLGFNGDEYIVGMDFPEAEGIYKSFYFPEEIFALTVRTYAELCISNGYKYVFIVNGHGAVNQNDTLRRLCNELTAKHENAAVEFAINFPVEEEEIGSIAHAGKSETSLIMELYPEGTANTGRLPDKPAKLVYRKTSIVDDGGFSGNPGEGYTVPEGSDPRNASREYGRKIFDVIVAGISETVRKFVEKEK